MKTMNGYAGAVGEGMYEAVPKAVFAAIAVSALTCGGDELEAARDRVLEEWWALYEAGIVPQKPTFLRPIRQQS